MQGKRKKVTFTIQTAVGGFRIEDWPGYAVPVEGLEGVVVARVPKVGVSVGQVASEAEEKSIRDWAAITHRFVGWAGTLDNGNRRYHAYYPGPYKWSVYHQASGLAISYTCWQDTAGDAIAWCKGFADSLQSQGVAFDFTLDAEAFQAHAREVPGEYSIFRAFGAGDRAAKAAKDKRRAGLLQERGHAVAAGSPLPLSSASDRAGLGIADPS